MRYISIDQAEVGMVVGKSIYNEQGAVLVNYKVKLTNKLIERMKEKGLSGFYIEDTLSQDIHVEDIISESLEKKAAQALHKMDIDEALDVANDITEELSTNGEISLNLVSLRTNSDYTYKHSVNVSVLSVLIGMGIGMKKTMLKELAAAGLLHDIGKINIPSDILNKPGALTEEEYELIKKHSEMGYEKIKDNVLISSKIKMGVYMHHENLNGTGYPLGLQDDQIYTFAKIIHVADVYDAITSKRVYKKAQAPAEAIDFLQKNVGTMFEKQLVDAFIKYVPVYPKGRNIILSGERIAVVVENRQENTLRPIVRYLDTEETVDLSQPEFEEIEILRFEE
ncbi:MAG: HD-GYP domain-containing protein [Eubacterium sp.]|nr:HD-GYP domain-containing protein [Eubacterium sp.]